MNVTPVSVKALRNGITLLPASAPARAFPPPSLVVTSAPLQPAAPTNRILANLPAADFQRISASLERVAVTAGQTLSDTHIPASYVFFPIDALVSLVYPTEDGDATEIALIGNEGLVGMNLFIGGGTSISQAVVQCAGSAYRMRASVLREEFNRCEPLRQLLLRYMHALLTQSSQTAVCNRHHSVEQQLCRWLLSALDRLHTNELKMTQESIANALGVRRAGVNEIATAMQTAGTLRYTRGKITVLDRRRLEHRACECYRVVKHEFAQMFSAAD